MCSRSIRFYRRALRRRFLLAGLVGVLAPLAHAWEHYGADPGGSKHSDLDQINAGNISQLTQAWVYQTGETGEGYAYGDNLSFQATPIYFDGWLYLTSTFGKAYAVDAGTGEEVWRFDSQIDPNEGYDEIGSRGVAIWHADEPLTVCRHRVFFGTLAGQLFALDAQTGKRCDEFGERGRVDLTKGVGKIDPGSYTITSPPVTIGGLVISGSAIGDNRRVESEKGIVRAFDARTGQLRWSWDPVPRDPGDPARSTWAGDSADVSGGANAWPPLSVDASAGLVFVPTGAPSPDFYGWTSCRRQSLCEFDCRVAR